MIIEFVIFISRVVMVLFGLCLGMIVFVVKLMIVLKLIYIKMV